MAKSFFLMLAQKLKKQDVKSWFWSRKLDGMRCYYDGGITRGMLIRDVPWANTLKDKPQWSEFRSTGLWSRYGKAIFAPDWWLNKLPPIPLDGELFGERWQTNQSAVTKHEPGPGWSMVGYHVFESPSYRTIFANRKLEEPNYSKKFVDIVPWLEKQRVLIHGPDRLFRETVYFMDNLERNSVLHVVPQTRVLSMDQLTSVFNDYVESGGEGLMIRSPSTYYECTRSKVLLKMKARDDAEGIVIGYKWGEETDKGSKLLGLMGSLRVKYNGLEFDLSGFTDEERTMTVFDTSKPGQIVSEEVSNPNFPRGSTITFSYRDLTDAGIPKEARYLRTRLDT